MTQTSRILIAPFFFLFFLSAFADERQWESIGPEGGETWAVVNVGAPDRLLAGTPSGVYISNDAGLHWTLLDSGFGAFDFVDLPGNVVWAWNWASLYRSTDGGLQWTQRGSTNFEGVTHIAQDPSASSTLYLSETRGLFKSTNGGESWVRLEQPGKLQQAIVTSKGAFAAWGYHIFRSTNRGQSWNLAFGPPSVPATAVPDIPWASAQDPNNASRLFYMSRGALIRSLDGGLTWQEISRLNGQPDVSRLIVDPHNSSKLFALTSNHLYISENSGGDWTIAYEPFEVDFISVDPRTTDRIWGAGITGASLSQSGETWEPRNTGMPKTPLSALGFDPRNSAVLYVGTSNQGIYRSSDAGNTWQNLELDPTVAGPIVSIAVQPSSGTLIVGGTEGIFTTSDEGLTWQYSEGSPLAAWKLVTSGQRVLAATLSGLYMSRDAGGTWETTRFHEGPIDALTSAGRGAIYLAYQGDVWFSYNGGLAWRRMGRPAVPPSQPAVQIASLAADPLRPGLLFLGTRYYGEVWRSTDAGQTWRLFSKTLPPALQRSVVSLVITRNNDRVLVAGTNSEVGPPSVFPTITRLFGHLERSQLATDDWQEFTPSLPESVPIHFMAISPDGRFLYVQNTDKRLYRLEL